MRKLNRNIAIAGSVVLFHMAALWALQAGLLRRAVETVVPVEILSEMVTPPAPRIEPPLVRKVEPAAPPRAPTRHEPVKPRAPRKIERAVPAPKPIAVPDSQPAPEAPTGNVTPMPAAPPAAAQVGPEVAAGAPSGSPGSSGSSGKVELPSSDADYLQNPDPVFPPISKRLGEQGKVVVRVLIDADGRPQKAELKRSSGFERLDKSAIDYVMRCRYVPGKVGGVPRAMWYDAPVSYVLE